MKSELDLARDKEESLCVSDEATSGVARIIPELDIAMWELEKVKEAHLRTQNELKTVIIQAKEEKEKMQPQLEFLKTKIETLSTERRLIMGERAGLLLCKETILNDVLVLSKRFNKVRGDKEGVFRECREMETEVQRPEMGTETQFKLALHAKPQKLEDGSVRVRGELNKTKKTDNDSLPTPLVHKDNFSDVPSELYALRKDLVQAKKAFEIACK